MKRDALLTRTNPKGNPMTLRLVSLMASFVFILGLGLTAASPPTIAHADTYEEIDVQNSYASQTQIYMTNSGNSYRIDPGEDWFLEAYGTLIKFPQSTGSWKLGYPGKGYPGACKTRGWLLDNDFRWNPPNVTARYVIRTWTTGNCT